MTRGEILQHLLSSCGGRLTNSAGQFRCNPAAWGGTSLVLAAPNPSGTPGWGGAVTGAGWTPRVNTSTYDRLSTWDALAPTTAKALPAASTCRATAVDLYRSLRVARCSSRYWRKAIRRSVRCAHHIHKWAYKSANRESAVPWCIQESLQPPSVD
jgi:hypothetical protein